MSGTGWRDSVVATIRAEAIRTHGVYGNPTQAEGILLRDADILERLGAIGAVRTLVKIGRGTRYSTVLVRMTRFAACG